MERASLIAFPHPSDDEMLVTENNEERPVEMLDAVQLEFSEQI
jgi:hypothetical protein